MQRTNLRRIYVGAVHQRIDGADIVDIFTLTDSLQFAQESLKRLEEQAVAGNMKRVVSEDMLVKYKGRDGNTMEAFILERLLLGKENTNAGNTEI